MQKTWKECTSTVTAHRQLALYGTKGCSEGGPPAATCYASISDQQMNNRLGLGGACETKLFYVAGTCRPLCEKVSSFTDFATSCTEGVAAAELPGVYRQCAEVP